MIETKARLSEEQKAKIDRPFAHNSGRKIDPLAVAKRLDDDSDSAKWAPVYELLSKAQD